MTRERPDPNPKLVMLAALVAALMAANQITVGEKK